MRLLSLFSGIGAFEKAMTNIGMKFEVVNYCEIDNYASKSYSAIHTTSEELNLRNVMDIDTNTLPDFDMMTFGFPCQDISVAGKGAGIEEGTRSGLYSEGMRILKDKLPKYSIIENVKNLVGKRYRETFEKILNDLSELGYTNYWKVMNARDYGVPQNRERVFIISILGDHKPFEFPEGMESRLKLKDLLEDEVEEKYYISDEKAATLISKWDKVSSNVGNTHPSGKGMNGAVRNAEGVSPAITTNKGEGPKVCVCVGNVEAIKGHDILKRVYSSEGLSPTIPTCCGGNQHPKIIEPVIGASRGRNIDNPSSRVAGLPTEQRLEINKQGIANTLTNVQKDNLVVEPIKVRVKEATKQGYAVASEGDSINFTHPKSSTRRGRVGREEANTLQTSCNQAILLPDYRIRKLTPKECFRLMGFDDTDFQKCVDAGMSNTQLYKQAGNSIVVNVLEGILKSILNTEGGV